MGTSVVAPRYVVATTRPEVGVETFIFTGKVVTGGYRGLVVSVVIHACTREGNVGWTFEGSSRRLPTDANGNFFGASVFQS